MMKGQKGITLVALVITIIVMLILVGVSITVALKGGLFDTAKQAKTEYETEATKEGGLNYLTYTDGTNTYEGQDAIDMAVNGTITPAE